MRIPDFQTLMLPVLELAADGQEHPIREARERLAEKFQLTPVAAYETKRIDSDYFGED